MSNETSETNITNTVTIKRGRGRPKGTGNIKVTLGELISRLGNDMEAEVPVKHLWWSAPSSKANPKPSNDTAEVESKEASIQFSIS